MYGTTATKIFTQAADIVGATMIANVLATSQKQPIQKSMQNLQAPPVLLVICGSAVLPTTTNVGHSDRPPPTYVTCVT
jgi:hypothetical protein